jgi:hypothetical protein
MDGGDFCALGTARNGRRRTDGDGLMAKTARFSDSGLGKRRRSQGVLVGAETGLYSNTHSRRWRLLVMYGQGILGFRSNGQRTDGGSCVYIDLVFRVRRW